MWYIIQKNAPCIKLELLLRKWTLENLFSLALLVHLHAKWQRYIASNIVYIVQVLCMRSIKDLKSYEDFRNSRMEFVIVTMHISMRHQCVFKWLVAPKDCASAVPSCVLFVFVKSMWHWHIYWRLQHLQLRHSWSLCPVPQGPWVSQL